MAQVQISPPTISVGAPVVPGTRMETLSGAFNATQGTMTFSTTLNTVKWWSKPCNTTLALSAGDLTVSNTVNSDGTLLLIAHAGSNALTDILITRTDTQSAMKVMMLVMGS